MGLVWQRAATTIGWPTGLGATFRALRLPNYRLFWLGQLSSQSGTWMQSTAQAWLVLRLTDSPLALGSVATVQFTPILLFSLIGGVLADRVPKRRLLLTTQTVLLVQALTLALLTASGQIRLWHLYCLAAVLGTANALDNPTRQSFVRELVPTEDLPNAIALNSMQFNLSRIVGPALSGLLITLVGVAGCFLLNAISSLAVLAAIYRIRPAGGETMEAGGAASWGRSVRGCALA
jgi:MFS family permease